MNLTPGVGKPLTIITGSTEHLKAFADSDALKRDCRISDWCVHDVRTLLTDLKHIDRKHDFTEQAVQQAIIEQRAFIPLIDGLVCAALGEKTDITVVPRAGGRRMFLHDRYGNQLAPTVAKMVQAWANNIHDTDGHREFNCMVFMLHSTVGRDGLRNAMSHAITWSEAPWIVMKASGIDISTFFAYDACHSNPAAIAIWNDLHAMMVDKYNLDAYVVYEHDHRTSDADTDSPHDNWRPRRSRSPRHNLADGPRGARTSGHRPISPDTRSSGHAPTRGSGNDRRSSKQEPSSGSGIDRRQGPSHPVYYDRDRTSDHADRTSERGRVVLPDYATLEPDAEVWWGVLRELEVDDQATRQLYALAQYDPDGRKAANSIIGKILKGASTKKEYRTTISAYVAHAVTTARHAIEPDWREAGKGRSEEGATNRSRGGKNQRRRGKGDGKK